MTNESPLTGAETRDLRAFAGTMIPASARYDAPGADDETIFADIVKSLGRDRDDIGLALSRLAILAGGAFADLPAARRLTVANELRAEGGLPFAALTRMILLCYYRDDRVMRSLGQDPRPPFPLGHVVEQGDWSLLDPVKKRAPFYRR
ncbi:hypothetical protein [Reyranella sp.]|uniref:hypothetical protein n=1 Tax=Reyranella sp. TaxID=1929291 RepID=UPI003D0C28A2